jgi:hypothetical protein
MSATQRFAQCLRPRREKVAIAHRPRSRNHHEGLVIQSAQAGIYVIPSLAKALADTATVTRASTHEVANQLTGYWVRLTRRTQYRSPLSSA